MTRRRLPLLLAIALLLLPSGGDGARVLAAAGPLRRAAPAEPIAIAHRVGTGWPGETLPRDPARIVRFALVDALGERPIDGEAGADPAGTIALRRPGIALAVYRSRPSPVRLEAEAFESYLREEGLERVIAARAARGESAAARRRDLLAQRQGDAGRARRRRRQRDARLLAPAGRPRPRARARDRSAAARRRRHVRAAPAPSRQAARGRAGQGLAEGRQRARRVGAHRCRRAASASCCPSAGIWLISAVHMIDAPAASGARWESLWSSLTFDAGLDLR